MDTQRLILVIALSFITLLLWDAWQLDHGAGKQQAADESESLGLRQAMEENATAPTIPMAIEPDSGQHPAVAVPETAMVGKTVEAKSIVAGEEVRVETDLLSVVLNSSGGDIKQVDLIKHGKDSEQTEIPFRLMGEEGRLYFVAQSGIKGGRDTKQSQYPGHQERYTVARTDFQLSSGENEIRVPMAWSSPDGAIEITKNYIFYRDSYRIDIEYQVENRGEKEWKGGVYAQLLRNGEAPEAENAFIYTYTGGVTYTQEELFQKVDFDEMEQSPLTLSTEKGWVAMIQHYFLGAVVPPKEKKPTLYTYQPSQGRYAIGTILPAVTVAPGSSGNLAIQLFVGPKDQERLEKIAEGLELTVDYGFLAFLAQPLFWILNEIHDVIGNWGFSIIILTILIKLVFYKLSETSYRSMAEMRKLTPRLTALKERYGDDRQKMNEAMMKIYREEKVNPMGGCLPILVQIPVFIALYWVLLESVEMRQAPFVLWIQDLSAMDPYYILPLVMGVSMLIQQKLNPAPLDPIQQKVMMILPIIFTIFFAFFPAGLVLYWVVNNIISIAQQYYITKKIEAH